MRTFEPRDLLGHSSPRRRHAFPEERTHACERVIERLLGLLDEAPRVTEPLFVPPEQHAAMIDTPPRGQRD